MTETVTVRGFLGSDVRDFTTKDGVPISTFRLASTVRRYDRDSGTWVNGNTNWYSVSSFRTLAQNTKYALQKGDPVIVTGRLRVRQWENDEGGRGTTAEIDAEAIGHDLGFGTSAFTRVAGTASASERRRAGAAANDSPGSAHHPAAEPAQPPEMNSPAHAAAGPREEVPF